MEEVCKQLGLEVIEKNIEAYDVHDADEAFMTGTPFACFLFTSFNHLSIGTGKVGPVFNKMINTWSNNVGLDIIKQIKNWDKNNTNKVSATTPYAF
jgi:branched-chain amino acid aminotransferase